MIVNHFFLNFDFFQVVSMKVRNAIIMGLFQLIVGHFFLNFDFFKFLA